MGERRGGQRAKGANTSQRIAHCTVEVVNDWGLHARPSARLSSLVKGFKSSLTVTNGAASADAKSVSKLLILEATKGSKLEMEATGPDADELLAAASDLFASGFDETHTISFGEGTKCGVAVGTAHVLEGVFTGDVPHRQVRTSDVRKEQQRLGAALGAETKHFRKMLRESPNAVAKEFALLLLAMIDDSCFRQDAKGYIAKHHVNAEWALKICVDRTVGEMSREDPVWEMRKSEYQQLKDRLINRLQKGKRKPRMRAGKGQIVVTPHIGPAEVLDFSRAGYAGFVTSGGSINSHAAILARNINFPGILALDGSALEEIDEDTRLVADSESGELHINPSKGSLDTLEKKAKESHRSEGPLKRSAPFHTVTRDGTRIHLFANSELLEEVDLAIEAGSEGIGLFRTEFLFINHEDIPSEDEQFETYRLVMKKCKNLPITFRTIDIGEEQMLGKGLGNDAPLGVRAIRFSLQNSVIFKQQLRALLRASLVGDAELKIMLPMISHVHELEEALRLLHQSANELGMASNDLPDLGVMIEVPAAVYILDSLANHADFFSIGSNDMMQYMLAIDRNEASLAPLADPHHPAIIKLLAKIIRESARLDKTVTLCGELAANPTMASFLCTLGLRNLSMSTSTLSKVHDALQGFSLARNARLAEEIVKSNSTARTRELLEELSG